MLLFPSLLKKDLVENRLQDKRKAMRVSESSRQNLHCSDDVSVALCLSKLCGNNEFITEFIITIYIDSMVLNTVIQ